MLACFLGFKDLVDRAMICWGWVTLDCSSRTGGAGLCSCAGGRGRAAPAAGGRPLYAAAIQMQTKPNNGRTREGRRISNGTDLAHMHFAPHE